MRRWLLWIPVLMVAALVYWTVALGLGGLSLMAVSGLSVSEEVVGLPAGAADTDTSQALPPQDGFEPILVRIEESDEPGDVSDEAEVDDSPGCGFTDELSADARRDELSSQALHRLDFARDP